MAAQYAMGAKHHRRASFQSRPNRPGRGPFADRRRRNGRRLEKITTAPRPLARNAAGGGGGGQSRPRPAPGSGTNWFRAPWCIKGGRRTGQARGGETQARRRLKERSVPRDQTHFLAGAEKPASGLRRAGNRMVMQRRLRVQAGQGPRVPGMWGEIRRRDEARLDADCRRDGQSVLKGKSPLRPVQSITSCPPPPPAAI